MSRYRLDAAHSHARFSVKHMKITTVGGGFEKMSGSLRYDATDPSSAVVNVTIDAASITTAERLRDENLRSADFLDVKKFPSLEFRSTKVEKTAGGLVLTGDLTLHGVTKPIAIAVKVLRDENGKLAASGTAKLKRKAFGLSWNAAIELGGVAVSDEVSITLEAQFIKEPI